MPDLNSDRLLASSWGARGRDEVDREVRPWIISMKGADGVADGLDEIVRGRMGEE